MAGRPVPDKLSMILRSADAATMDIDIGSYRIQLPRLPPCRYLAVLIPRTSKPVRFNEVIAAMDCVNRRSTLEMRALLGKQYLDDSLAFLQTGPGAVYARGTNTRSIEYALAGISSRRCEHRTRHIR